MKGPFSVCSLCLFLSVVICESVFLEAANGQESATSPNRADLGFVRFGTGRTLIRREKQVIRVIVGNHDVPLDYYTDLFIVTIRDEKTSPDKLVGQAIAIVRDPNQKEQWNAFLGAGGGAGADEQALVLAGNVFRVRGVLAATEKNRVSVQVGQQTHQLKRGEVLLILG